MMGGIMDWVKHPKEKLEELTGMTPNERKQRAREGLGGGMAGQASDKTANYEQRLKNAIDAETEGQAPSESSQGRDAGELGKKWKDTFR
jgi:hypothetical protein